MVNNNHREITRLDRTHLDHVARALALDDDAPLGGVAAAAAAVDQEARPAAHIVGRRGIQVVAVWHALKGVHVSQSVCALWKWSNRDTTMRGRRIIEEPYMSYPTLTWH